MSVPQTPAQLQQRIDEIPFHRLLGVKAESLDKAAGEVVLRIPFRPDLQRSDEAPQMHGGVTAALVDIAGDYALLALLGYGVPTINLRVDYLRMVEDSDLIATARIVKAGRSIGVVDVSVADTSGREVAVGRGTFSTKPG